jgi:hypothetical protein
VVIVCSAIVPVEVTEVDTPAYGSNDDTVAVVDLMVKFLWTFRELYGDFFAIASVIEHLPVDLVLIREPETEHSPFADHVFVPAEFVEAIADVLMFDDGVNDDTFHVTEGVRNAATG